MSANITNNFQSTISASDTKPSLTGNGLRFWLVLGVEVILLLLIAVLLRAVGLGEEASHDELYNFLAARGLLEHGDFLIVANAQPYDRAALFTRAAAVCMALFGHTLSAARIPALLAGSLLVCIVFLWLRLRGERMAGWLAGILIALDPLLIQLSQIVRFYSFQHLAFMVGSIGVYMLLYHRSSAIARLITLSLTAVSFFISFSMQPVCIFGFGGLLLFAVAVIYWMKIRHLNLNLQLWIALATGAICCAVIAYAYSVGLIGKFIAKMNYADLWASQSVDNPRFYYAILYSNYAPLWSIFPLLLLFAVKRQPRMTMLCAAVFGMGFIWLSIAAWKAERYFSFLIPFFLIIAAIGSIQGLEYLFRYLRSLTTQYRFSRISEKGTLLVGMAIFGFAMMGNYAFLTTARLLTRDHTMSFALMGQNDGGLSWSQAAKKLKQIADEVEVVVSSDDLKSIYYLGRADYALSPNSLRSLPEFTSDKHTGASIVASVDAISTIMKRHKSGLFIVQAMSLGQSATQSPRLAATRLVAERAELIDLPKSWGIVAYRWQSPSDVVEQNRSPSTYNSEKNGTL